MTCDRAYTDSAIRQHRAELADELRQWVVEYRHSVPPQSYEAAYRFIMLDTFLSWLDELSPPIHCDNPPNHPVTDEVAFYEAQSK